MSGVSIPIPEAETLLCSTACSLNPKLAVWGTAVVPSVAMAPSLPTDPTLATLLPSEAPSLCPASASWWTSSPAGKSVARTPEEKQKQQKQTPQTLKINCPDENKWCSHLWHGSTWHASDAPHVGVASVEAVQQVSRLSGVQNQNLGGGVWADAHPHSTGHLVLQRQLLVLVPSLLNTRIEISARCTPRSRPQHTPSHLILLF